MKKINGGICAAKGFKASGMYCGIKTSGTDSQNPDMPHKNDICMYVSDTVCTTAAVYTQNKVKGAPITVTKANLEKSGNKAVAVIANSKNANTCNVDGIEKAEKMCALVADELNIPKEQVVVASTGVIGLVLPIEPVEKAVPLLAQKLDYHGNAEAASAIMTTDTVMKEYAVEFEIGGKICHLGGMAKGSGMIHPNMATTLNFITTDCSISHALLQKTLSDIVKITYNCLSVDGDTSTNDMVCLMANGMAENKTIDCFDENYNTFKAALYEVMANLTKMLAKDGEGATKLIMCEVNGAKNEEEAVICAKSVICSPLVKTAMFGADANCGRILGAIGYADIEIDPLKIDVSYISSKGCIDVCKGGYVIPFSEEKAKEILLDDEVTIKVNLNQGSFGITAYGCDLTYDYVKINGDYRS
ncbi:MAG: bifunctional glutamate N-acetyltransferase/amino-acid acetyltransferase ArgJ [Eubacterium sp.]